MKCCWFLLLTLGVCIDAKGLFKFKSATLESFNGARRLLASGALKPLIDVVNGIAKQFNIGAYLSIPEFGPAANMHKLRWSPKLEHMAYKYGKGKGLLPTKPFHSFPYEGFAGFEWKGVLLELIQEVVKGLPIKSIKMVLEPVLNILDQFLTALLLMVNYPTTIPMNPIDKRLGATEALFAHRYEIGCYAKLSYAVCFMEPSRNKGYLYEPGVPCSKCTTHCEFFEDINGIILEGDLCEPPVEDSNATSTLEVKKESLVESRANKSNIMFFNSIFIGIPSILLLAMM